MTLQRRLLYTVTKLPIIHATVFHFLLLATSGGYATAWCANRHLLSVADGR